MIKEDITKELDKFEIPYEAGAGKAALQSLLDAELAKRASGAEDYSASDADVDDLLDIAEAEPAMSEEDKAKLLPAAEANLAAGVKALAAATAKVEQARTEAARLLPSKRQLGLAECVAGFQKGVRSDIAVKAEMEVLTKRFQTEAAEILDTA